MYDTCYRRKAAAAKSLDWAQVDFTLYNETFTGRAKAIINRFKICSSEHHTSGDCVLAPEPPRRNRQRYEDTRPTNYTCQLYIILMMIVKPSIVSGTFFDRYKGRLSE